MDYFATSCSVKHPDGFTTARECPKEDMRLFDADPLVFVLALQNGAVVNERGYHHSRGKNFKRYGGLMGKISSNSFGLAAIFLEEKPALLHWKTCRLFSR